jgi:hypothetical protein
MLDENDKDMLRIVGEAMTMGMSPQTNFGTSLGSFAAHKEEIIACLAEGAEDNTDGLETVRELNSGIWMNPPLSGNKLYVIVCPSGTPAGPVTEITQQMKPYLMGPNGIDLLEPKPDKAANK